jgi:RNA-binding protein 8A
MSDLEYDGEPEQVEHADAEPEQQKQRLKSTVAGKKKGRGFREERQEDAGGNSRYEALEPTGGAGLPAKSVEGYVLFVTGLHEEAQEEDVAEAFADYGDVKNVYLNLDRQTGYVKGYALIEYATEQEARDAIKNLDGTKLLDEDIHVTWAFVKGPQKPRRGRH